jgi:hypothetical protein
LLTAHSTDSGHECCWQNIINTLSAVLSEGQVNIFNLAENASASVDQIERFFARNLPLSKEMAMEFREWIKTMFYEEYAKLTQAPSDEAKTLTSENE